MHVQRRRKRDTLKEMLTEVHTHIRLPARPHARTLTCPVLRMWGPRQRSMRGPQRYTVVLGSVTLQNTHKSTGAKQSRE